MSCTHHQLQKSGEVLAGAVMKVNFVSWGEAGGDDCEAGGDGGGEHWATCPEGGAVAVCVF